MGMGDALSLEVGCISDTADRDQSWRRITTWVPDDSGGT